MFCLAALIRAGAMVALLLALPGAAGCSAFQYDPPPSVAAPAARSAGPRVVAIAPFSNPPMSPLAWTDVGIGVAEELAATLRRDGEVDARVDPVLGRAVDAAIKQAPERRPAMLADLDIPDERLQYIITGRVTDFTHSFDKPREARRWGLLGRKREAFVAVTVDLVDLRTGEILGSDRISGMKDAPRRSTPKVYEGLAFGSYLFWNTPLGGASRSVVEKIRAKIEKVLPYPTEDVRVVQPSSPPPAAPANPAEPAATADTHAPPAVLADARARDDGRVTRRVGRRELTIERDEWLDEGVRYLLIVTDAVTGKDRPVVDRDTGLPLEVRIVDGPNAGWLLGEPEVGVSLEGARLRRRPA